MTKSTKPFTAVVLAGDRAGGEPVAKAAGVPCKSFAPVAGRPMVLRVLDTLAAAQEVSSSILCGPSRHLIDQQAELQTRIVSGQVKWIKNQATPSLSTYHTLQTLSDNLPVLVTTADHALLNTQIVDYFCSDARRMGCEVVVGLVSYERVMAAFPGTKRTAIKFQDGAFCGCNLFAFMSSRARKAVKFWSRIEKERKKPLRMIRILGWSTVVRYIVGKISLDEGLEQISRQLQIRAGAIILPFPEAAIDVDTVNDWRFVQNVVANPTPVEKPAPHSSVTNDPQEERA
jgi:GTP:adenosylcobinamide-phosphate guanylyltransferase